jgi:hypothetical protein
MTKDHPSNGPTFSKPPQKKRRPITVPSPAREKAASEETARTAAKERAFHKKVSEVGLARTLGLIKD